MAAGVIRLAVDTSLLDAQLAQLSHLAVEVPNHLAHGIFGGLLARFEGGAADFFFCEDVTTPGADGVHLRMGIASVEFESLLAALGASHV
jgi:hypothetical protein